MKPPSPSRLGPVDLLSLGSHGMRTRPLRAVLSALGIAIGIAAMVSVLAIPESSAKALREQLAALGTNLLRAEPGQTFFGEDAVLPDTAVPMAERIGPVLGAAATGNTGKTVRRTDKVAESETSGLSVQAANPDLLGLLGGTLKAGEFLGAANADYPVVVLGSVAATRLGIDRIDAQQRPQVWIGDRWFTVIGILDPMPLAAEIERAVLVGWTAAQRHLGFDGRPSTVYARAEESRLDSVRQVLAATLNPAHPDEVKVSRPSDAIEAQRLTENTYSALFLGLGGVALLVGGVGVANTMVISVLERRREIGLRRALGATRRQVRGQFLTESMLLSALGGASGVLLGVLATAGYSLSQDWPAVLPVPALVGGVGVAAVVGAVAGAYPAMRAARLPPTVALA
ncbi:putative ABC transport system permease protein [Amycolatopsis magusensis]|uniref:ABC transport system permease protein n=2 Tax=Amycolatopsis magusensis TaxID=882444 RepID=A0ABS4PHZ8_9PSEU|nr:putative ABC transport system permease protein [Amycolatopsis magusensis]